MSKKLIIFDGSNFYHKSKRLAPEVHLTYFNYRRLAELITNSKESLEIEYCVGEIKRERNNQKSRQMYNSQMALFTTLRLQNIAIHKGFMMKNNDIYSEKGVDVKIATDILRGAFLDEYDECYIISSDTDIIPAIRCAIDFKKKKIIYVGFENFISKALQAQCSKTIILKKENLSDSASVYLSALMGATNITDEELKDIGIKILSGSLSGTRKLEISAHKLSVYEQLIMDKLDNGFWNDIIGLDKITFIFKFKNGAIKKLVWSPNSQNEIAQLCHEFNNDPLEKTSDVLKYLSENGFYTEAIKSYQNRGTFWEPRFVVWFDDR
jgi:uncharacterized protein (TIGR00288 family)